MDRNTKRIWLACGSANVTMSIVGNLSALLFLTFHDLYGVSFSLLGLLVLVNFATQLGIDLVFSFFSHKFNISAAVKTSPWLCTLGLIIYGLSPFIFKDSVYVGILIGTVIFSASSGLNEVLISPVIAALPSENPERDMSKTHSIYAWGVVAIVTFSTLFLRIFGKEYWYFLPLIYTVVPLFASIMYSTSTLPALETPAKVSGALSMFKSGTLWLVFVAIFCGGACEITMSQWASSYLEQALHIPKVWGDIFGLATFAIMLGLGRTLYAKYGKNIEKVLFLCGLSSLACYFICIISPIPIIGLIACALTGLAVSMMWPGSLVVAAKRITTGGVFIYAIMAAGGDLGASVAPQLVGVITDLVSANGAALSLAQSWGISLEQLSMKLGMCIGVLFSVCATIVFWCLWHSQKRIDKEKTSNT